LLSFFKKFSYILFWCSNIFVK